MDQVLYKAMFSRIQNEIIKDQEELQTLAKIDFKYCKVKIYINKLVEIIENYKKINIQDTNKKMTIICNGNPYIVLNIIMIAIIKGINLKINIDNTMLGINKYILQKINNILKENKIELKIELTEKIEGEKIIFIDRINDFNLIKNKKENIIFIPYQSIDIYSEGEEFEELYEKVYNYAIDMNIDVDIFDDEGIETMLKYGQGRKKLILTNKKEIENQYKDKEIYINENPFKNEEVIFKEQLINTIINF